MSDEDEKDGSGAPGGARVLSIIQKDAERKSRGRPHKLERIAPLEELHRRRDEYVAKHPIVLANPLPTTQFGEADMQNLLRHQMAKEVAALEYNRDLLDQVGSDTSQISSRIINTLQKISAIGLEVKKLGNVVIDPHSEEVQRMFVEWTKKLTVVVKEMVDEGALDAQTMDLFFSKFSNAMDGWEDTLGGGDS